MQRLYVVTGDNDLMSDLKKEIIVKASVREASDNTRYDHIYQAAKEYKDLDKDVFSELEVAAGPLDDKGRPRMLIVSAWIVHEGRNRNGQAFIKEELEQAAGKGLFKPPHAGLIDLDHDFQPRGFWFTANYAFDEEAKLWGIAAEGAIWAWRFEELSNALLVEMQREGHIFVSMAALPESVELTGNFPEAEGQFTEILHDPVFYGASLLTVAPGDADARGLVSETSVPDIQATDEDSTAKADLDDSLESDNALVVAHHKRMKEEVLMEKELELLQAKLNEAIEAKVQAEQSLVSARAEIEVFVKDKDELTANLAAAQTKLDELQVAFDTANEVKTTVESELETTKQELDSYKVAEQEAELETRFTTRLEQLPEAVAINLDKHENADEIKKAWRDQTDEEWEKVISNFSLAASTESTLVDASNKEGSLSTNQSKTGGKASDLSDCIRTN